jgi:quercetin dioxygenase-like cupin family protein
MSFAHAQGAIVAFFARPINETRRKTMTAYGRTINRPGLFVICCTLAGLAIGAIGGHGLAEMAPPAEHKGLGVEKLGVISEDSMKATIGLEGHILQLRAITIDPGGQIAKHGHETRPGLVKVIGGAWVEGRESGETTFDAGTPAAIIEDENTVHWFYNRGDTPATAIVCDINPAS